MTYLLGPTSADSVEVFPEWDYKSGAKKLEKRHRLENGDYYVYKTGEYDRIQFKVKFFDSSDASLVNSWWESNTELQFYDGTNVASVMLRNDDTPFSQFQKPYTDLMQGMIKLEGY